MSFTSLMGEVEFLAYLRDPSSWEFFSTMSPTITVHSPHGILLFLFQYLRDLLPYLAVWGSCCNPLTRLSILQLPKSCSPIIERYDWNPCILTLIVLCLAYTCLAYLRSSPKPLMRSSTEAMSNSNCWLHTLKFLPQQFGAVCENDSSRLSMHLCSRLLPRPRTNSPLKNRAYPMENINQTPSQN